MIVIIYLKCNSIIGKPSPLEYKQELKLKKLLKVRFLEVPIFKPLM